MHIITIQVLNFCSGRFSPGLFRVAKINPQPLLWIDFEGLSRLYKPLIVLKIKCL